MEQYRTHVLEFYSDSYSDAESESEEERDIMRARMHEKLERMEKEIARTKAEILDEQWKRTLAEQQLEQLEQKIQEGVNVFKRLSSKLSPNAFASEVPATTSELPTSQLSTAELPNKVTEKNLTSSTEQQERSMPRSAIDLSAESQILSAPANNDVVNAHQRNIRSRRRNS